MKLIVAVFIFFCLFFNCHALDYKLTDGASFRKAFAVLEKARRNESLSRDEVEKLVFVQGYLKGFYDASEIARQMVGETPYLLPDDANVQTIASVSGAYLDKHPEFLEQPVSLLILAALCESFPNKAFKMKKN